jgi:hypothetical protein
MKVLIYSAIFGEYDHPKDIVKQSIDTDFMMVTDSQETHDEAVAKGWQVMMVDGSVASTPRMRNRYYKTKPLAIPGDYDIRIYIDGSAYIKSHDLTKMCVSQLGGYPLMVFRHPEGRDCIYQEAEYASTMPKYLSHKLVEWAAQYKQEGMPEHFGLWACGMLVTRNDQLITNLFGIWFQEQVNGCGLDQIALPYLLWKTGAPIKTLELDQYHNDYIEFAMSEHKNIF